MTGRDYIAQVRLSTKADATLALPGETCERVPDESLGWLADQGLIKTREELVAARRPGEAASHDSDAAPLAGAADDRLQLDADDVGDDGRFDRADEDDDEDQE